MFLLAITFSRYLPKIDALEFEALCRKLKYRFSKDNIQDFMQIQKNGYDVLEIQGLNYLDNAIDQQQRLAQQMRRRQPKLGTKPQRIGDPRI
ncbi:hypothetical protein PoB_005436900 [Plakobranchus ocellatus]|uniref:Uncharacterized protein n=1 Tax=Plakobranchus ocellatus TaxID=259542 RepID=A0AAV4C9X8_9GAST|nr:hypothetical protein PoB_005436900 [Plakobranchus ocellatus]